MYIVKTPKFIQNLFPSLTWNVATEQKILYLTFDDGPIPEVTPWVLDQLAAYSAKATFFCVGDNIRKNPEVYRRVIESGHDIGSHTFNHLSGWDTDNITYFRNIRRGAHLVKTDLFRPPYGRIKPSQSSFLQRYYRIIMWDVLSGDFDTSLSPEQCYRNVLENTNKGSVIVFHDSLKAADRMKYALPRVLEHFSELGYRFCGLNKYVPKPDAQLQEVQHMEVAFNG